MTPPLSYYMMSVAILQFIHVQSCPDHHTCADRRAGLKLYYALFYNNFC